MVSGYNPVMSSNASTNVPKFDQIIKGNVKICKTGEQTYKITFLKATEFTLYQVWNENSDNSKRKAALCTARSIMSYAQECYFYKEALDNPDNWHNGGGNLCSSSVTPWPKLSVETCNYALPSDYGYRVECGGDIGNIVCDAFNGDCTEE